MLAIIIPLAFVLILLFEIGGEENEQSACGQWKTAAAAIGSATNARRSPRGSGARDCRSVALSTTRYDLEYTIWRLLGAPESGIVLQQILPSEATRRYMDPAFSPCAVFCTVCDGLPLSPNLSLEADYGYIRLYIRNGG